jgi:predicted transcriptional regulator
MKKQAGMRPQDVVVLLKIAANAAKPWQMKDLARELVISNSEISESLHRSVVAGLINADKKRLMKGALIEFLKFGLKYVYPQHPGAIVRGMATAHSANPLKRLIQSDENYVWSWAEGNKKGQAIQPLHPSVPIACRNDEKLYELLALTDAIRIGKKREVELAILELEKRLNEE